jgi:hypothetical protein
VYEENADAVRERFPDALLGLTNVMATGATPDGLSLRMVTSEGEYAAGELVHRIGTAVVHRSPETNP